MSQPKPSRGTAHGAVTDRLSPTVFRSPAFVRTIRSLKRFAAHPWVPVLLEGEPGTGKTSLARWLHDESCRAPHPFAHVLLSAIDDGLVSSVLFGHVKGAFTDARADRAGQFGTAHRGTIFLDEIGKASPITQQRLLNAIEYGEIMPVGSDRPIQVDARIIAATNVNLPRLVADGRFLPDLNARLELFRIVVPPLRNRRADIPLFVERSLKRYAADCGYTNPPAIDQELMEALQRADWPNNVRELDATIHRLLIDADGTPVLTLAHCEGDLKYLRGVPTMVPSPQAMEAAIAKSGGVSAAARLLGVDRSTIYRRLARG